MKIFKLLPATLLYFFEGEGGGGGDVQVDSSPSTESATADNADSSTALAESSVSEGLAGSETATDAASETDPLEGLPTAEELETQVAQNVPYAKGLQSLRGAYEALKSEHEPLKAWKSIAESIPDPATVQSNQELLSLLYSPTQSGDLNDFSTTPFLQKLEEDSPGAVDKLYRDLTTFQIEGENGRRDTVVRHMVRSWGLNPDNLEKYRQLENGTLPVASGIVNSEELAKIDPQFHEAFKSLSPTARQDIFTLSQATDEASRLLANEHLRNAQTALEAKTFREQIQQKEQAEQRKQEADTAAKIESESSEAIDAITSEVYTSILSTIAQVKVSSDETENMKHQAGVMSNLYTLLDPAGRKLILEPLLGKMGISLDSTIAGVQVKFDDTVQTLAAKTAEAIRWEHYGDKRQAQIARADANRARQILTAKLNQIAFKMIGASNGNGNSAAPARLVPNGNGMQQQGSQNPYDANPHPFGTNEYVTWNRKLDRQLAAVSQ